MYDQHDFETINMNIEVVRSDKSTPENAVWKFIQNGEQFLHLEIDDQPLWGIGWNTLISTIEGINAIRQSYFRLKEIYQETRTTQNVAVSTMTPISEHPQITNPHSLDTRINWIDHLGWIRLDTEYLSYFFEGELTPLHNDPDGSAMDPPEFPSRDFGLLGIHSAVDEVLQLFQQTSSTKLDASQLSVVHKTLEKLLGTFPTFNRRHSFEQASLPPTDIQN